MVEAVSCFDVIVRSLLRGASKNLDHTLRTPVVRPMCKTDDEEEEVEDEGDDDDDEDEVLVSVTVILSALLWR